MEHHRPRAVTLEQARASLERRNLTRRLEGERRAALLRSRLPEVVDILRARHGVTSIRLFGSLARGDGDAYSDIDVAVEGLAPARYFEALGDVMGVARCPVDLVCLESAPHSLRDRVLAEGESL